jgi:hypothetical protein
MREENHIATEFKALEGQNVGLMIKILQLPRECKVVLLSSTSKAKVQDISRTNITHNINNYNCITFLILT